MTSVPDPEADPALPPRSRLVALEPLGAGAPAAEGLPSYLLRLAAVHSLDPGVLAELLIAPVTAAGRTSDAGFRVRFLGTGHAIAGTEDAARAWSSRIGELTGRSDIEGLTLRWLRDLVGHRALLRGGGVCPVCLQEARDAERTPYEPLAWSVLAVTVCIRHQTVLETSCPGCGRPLRALGWRARVGHCRRCDAWLGGAGRQAEPQPFERWAAEQVGRIIAFGSASSSASFGASSRRSSSPSCSASSSSCSASSSLSSSSSSCSSCSFCLRLPERPVAPSPSFRPPVRADFVAAIDAAICTVGTQGEMARRLGVSKSSIGSWRRGTIRPELSQLLGLAAAAGCDPLALLLGRVAAIDDAPPVPSLGRRRVVVDWSTVERVISREAAARRPRSLRSISAELGVWHQTLIGHYPEETRRIRVRYEAAVGRRARGREARLAHRLTVAVRELRAAGRSAARRQVEQRSGVSVRERAMGEAWRAARDEGWDSLPRMPWGSRRA